MCIDIPFKNMIAKFSVAFVASVIFVFPLNAAETNQQKFASSNPYIVAHKDDGCGMNKMDSNGDGAISKDEFMAHAEKKFSKKDKNGDGVISEEEKKGMKKEGKDKCKKHKSHS